MGGVDEKKKRQEGYIKRWITKMKDNVIDWTFWIHQTTPEPEDQRQPLTTKSAEVDDGPRAPYRSEQLTTKAEAPREWRASHNHQEQQHPGGLARLNHYPKRPVLLPELRLRHLEFQHSHKCHIIFSGLGNLELLSLCRGAGDQPEERRKEFVTLREIEGNHQEPDPRQDLEILENYLDSVAAQEW